MEKHQFRKFSSIEEIIIDGTTGKNRKNSIEIKTFKNRIYQSIINLIIYILMIIGFVCVIFIINQYIEIIIIYLKMDKEQFRKYSSIEEIRIHGSSKRNRKISNEINNFKNNFYQSIINLIIYILIIIGLICVVFIISQYLILKNKLKNTYNEYIQMNERIEELKSEKELLNVMLSEEIRIQKKLYKELEKIQETLKK